MKATLLILVLALAGVSSAKPQAASPRPNIIVILIDDLGWADLSCHGSTFYRTPNIDRLASQGVRFTNGYSACVVCSPTRAAILTGRHPARTGVTDWIRCESLKAHRPPTIASLPGFAGTPQN